MVIMLTFHTYVVHVYVRTYAARVYWTTLILLTRFYVFFLFLLPSHSGFCKIVKRVEFYYCFFVAVF